MRLRHACVTLTIAFFVLFLPLLFGGRTSSLRCPAPTPQPSLVHVCVCVFLCVAAVCVAPAFRTAIAGLPFHDALSLTA
ncbi:hypothetical protein LMJF_29_1605 [Leishmania major strain Friedlin]|uniref:Secreted peptide n=1 Tax=Leishmania major TaxID=5664 RepID=E9AE22_LEIMA|nr:hypothetical protein LMJF_29_1605 [Leishmania major strain Friedlin]CAG9577901.1 Endomembrane_protein_70_-_putative [Leishmania major strain Friedlin]CBZ12501.1 hypothetical protein LMJF_29_1605 [Leishmania major strain Friedlin]|eukprot:XP_003722243.1 hypothetical protein LMJF_29_1605 [Leishmania major strain Friedlin]